MRAYIEKKDGNVVNPSVGTSFDSLDEAYQFYNLFSWEVGFGIKYAKSRLNVHRSKCMQEIVCGCAGKPVRENSISTRTGCAAMIRLLRSDDNGWYICEHKDKHNHSLSATCGQPRYWSNSPMTKAVYQVSSEATSGWTRRSGLAKPLQSEK